MSETTKPLGYGNQLILNIKNRDRATFANFHVSKSNAISIATLHGWLDEVRGPLLYFYGTEGVGKTHLLSALCEHYQEAVLYLPLKKESQLSTTLLESGENLRLVALDDLENIVGNLAWEKAIFNLYNNLFLSGGRLLVSAKVPPQFLDFVLPDLKSRLSSGLILPLTSLNDDEKVLVLQKRAAEVNVKLPLETTQFLLQHCQRDLEYLLAVLTKLLDLALLEKRNLTVPFVRKHLVNTRE